jgi:hypothetical protein
MSIGANNGLFTGIHNGKLDEKNRVTIPAAWRFDAEATFLAMYHPALHLAPGGIRNLPSPPSRIGHLPCQ